MNRYKTDTPIRRAERILGQRGLARVCGVANPAVLKWIRAGHLPRTAWTGEADYPAMIERATVGAVTAAALLACRPRSGGYD